MTYQLTTLFQKFRKIEKKYFFIIYLILISSLNIYSQEINYYYLQLDSESLKSNLLKSDDFFSGGNDLYPYFQSKYTNLYIKLHKSTGVIAIFDFKSESDYFKLIREIQKKANFRYKFCTDYNEPIVYNYETYSGNKIRFDFSEMKMSVEYPSKVNSFLNNNSDFTTVFQCISKGAYAFHTNLKCEGLGNCDTKIAKSNIREAKKHGYRFCEICTDDE